MVGEELFLPRVRSWGFLGFLPWGTLNLRFPRDRVHSCLCRRFFYPSLELPIGSDESIVLLASSSKVCR